MAAVQTSEEYGQLCANAVAETEALFNLLLRFDYLRDSHLSRMEVQADFNQQSVTTIA